LPKPKGSIGSTKMKIMAIIHYNTKNEKDCYGYGIWQYLKKIFHTYLNDCDIRNVYHHLNDLCDMKYLEKKNEFNQDNRGLYRITSDGLSVEGQYKLYLSILEENVVKSRFG
jgi:DNA-binding PadR family transcriptional regulator